jgi:hypothetical protein
MSGSLNVSMRHTLHVTNHDTDPGVSSSGSSSPSSPASSLRSARRFSSAALRASLQALPILPLGFTVCWCSVGKAQGNSVEKSFSNCAGVRMRLFFFAFPLPLVRGFLRTRGAEGTGAGDRLDSGGGAACSSASSLSPVSSSSFSSSHDDESSSSCASSLCVTRSSNE